MSYRLRKGSTVSETVFIYLFFYIFICFFAWYMTPTLFPFHYRLLLIKVKGGSVRTHPGKVTSQCNVWFWAVEDTETQRRRKQKRDRGSPKSSEPSSNELSALTALNTCFWQITPQWLQFLLRICFLKHAFKSQKLAPDCCHHIKLQNIGFEYSSALDLILFIFKNKCLH